MKTYKSKNVNQYQHQELTVCVTKGNWRTRLGIGKDSSATLFYGHVHGTIERKLAAGMLMQWRKDGRIAR